MSTPVNLRFVTPVSPTPGEVALRFGADAEFAPRVEGVLATSLPASLPPDLSIAAAGELTFELMTDVGPGVAARHGRRPTQSDAVSAAQQAMRPTNTPSRAHQTNTLPLSVVLVGQQSQMLPASRAGAARQQQAVPLGVGAAAVQEESVRLHRGATSRAQHAIPLGIGARNAHQERIRIRHPLRSEHQHAEKTIVRAVSGHQHAIPLALGAAVRHQQMIPLPLGWWQIAYPWPEPPLDPNAPSSPVSLRFCRLSDGTNALIFGCPTTDPEQPGTTIIVPVRRTYLVLNTITLVRASDGTPLSALGLNLQIDADSWTWGWDATIPGAQLALVEPVAAGDPVELIATLNGTAYRLLAERIARDRSFGQARIRISGRGRAAMLAGPHSPIVTRSNAAGARTAQQLLGDALTTNGVGIGWAVDWQAADWLVPAGLYNHTGTYIEHAQRLAEAAGAYVQADPLTDTLHILPRYPLLPWEWAAATPDLELPTAPVVRESVEWLQRPDYNRVFVSGTEAGGVLGQVTRNGTAGDIVAPMVTDPLCTHADAARARGRPILADTGRQARITLDLPILPETGIITPGKLVRYTDGPTQHLGLVRATRVTAALPTARQSIELETHA